MSMMRRFRFVAPFLALALALALAFTFAFPVNAQTVIQLTADDRAQIGELFETVEQGVRVSGFEGTDIVRDIVAPDEKYGDFYNDIFKGIPFKGNITSFGLTNRNQIAASGVDEAKFTATLSVVNEYEDYTNTTVSYFVFQKIDGHWYLKDSDFWKYLGSTFVQESAPTDSQEEEGVPVGSAGFFGIVALFGGLVVLWAGLAILAFVFWIWMLVTIIRRPHFPNKTLWFLVVLFLQLLGAIIYYFAEHRAYKKSLAITAAPQTTSPAVKG